MLHEFLLDVKFHQLLILIDNDFAKKAREKGCTYCFGKLYHADYPRSPFGVDASFRDYYQSRCSLCCARCRKRTTPPSVRFLGRRWYVAPLFLLVNALCGTATKHQLATLQKYLGLTINKRTWQRWRNWWRTCFSIIPFWTRMKGIVPIHTINGPFPEALLIIFSGSIRKKLVTLLRFLAPITAGALRAV